VRSWCFALVVIILGACGGGSYATGSARGGQADRGETNGRTFELVSNKPDGDDWQIRIRDSSMWAAYSAGEDVEDLGNVNLSGKETETLWGLIDEVDVGGRDRGRRDEDEGYVQLRISEPGGEEGHDKFSIYVSRATEDEAVLDLGAYLQKLIKKYHKKEADF
jgi:hypothetical protein